MYSKLGLAEKVNTLNRACDGTLTIDHYHEWEIGSYGPETLFSAADDRILDKNFEACVDKAIKKLDFWR